MLCVPKYDRFYPDLINRNTVTDYNAGDPHSINGGNWSGGHAHTNQSVFPLPGPAHYNVQSVVDYEMYDPGNLDFRPLPNSTYCKLEPGQAEYVGPYTCGTDYQWYWIPGRQSYKASTPVPPDGSNTIKPSATVLMWLPALGALSQKVTFGPLQRNNCSRSANAEEHAEHYFTSEQVSGTTNVFRLPKQLQSKTTYCWSVECQLEDGARYEGDAWSFTTL